MITWYIYTFLTINEVKVVQTLDEFKVIESLTMIILDQRDDGSLDKYISMF